ncbi:MAG: transglutaminase family protein [Acidobacteria bacterium]|nr:transglutaminase family protein [Acidobacteriota bacterium]
MKLRVEHITTFTYDSPISEAYTEMRLAPLDLGGQRRTAFELVAEPRGDVISYLDRFGNEVHYFDVLNSHQQLTVTARSEIQTTNEFKGDEEMFSPLDQYDYLQPTHYTPDDIALHVLAEQHVVAGNKAASTYALMAAVHEAIAYERGATDVKTTADEAIRLGKGVCQDYAHVMLAVCRLSKLPARYVSGYLYSPNAPEMASHAWVDVYVDGHGWRALDPTHNCPQDERYVRVATGRDYTDVPPTRGIYKGKATEKMEIQVMVSAV